MDFVVWNAASDAVAEPFQAGSVGSLLVVNQFLGFDLGRDGNSAQLVDTQ